MASLRPGIDDARLVDDAPGMTLREVFAEFWPVLRPLRGWLLLGLALLAVASVIEILEIMLFQRLVDDVLVPADFSPLLWIALTYLGLNLLSGLVGGGDDILSTWVSQRFLVGLRTDTFRHVLALPLHVHEQRRLGDVLSRLTADIATVERFMVGYVTSAVGSVLRILLYVTALFWLQWELALVSMIVVPMFWFVATRFAGFVKDVSRERARRGGSLGAVAEEAIAAAPLVQAYNREESAVAGFHRQNRGIADAELASSRVRSVFLPAVDLAELAGVLCVVTLGTWALATDRLTLGGLFAFLTLMMQCYRPIGELSDLLPSLFSATAGIERVVELRHEPPLTQRADARELTDPKGLVQLDDVWVRYPGARNDALRGLDLTATPGEVLAVVGPSGAGKSTLARLLTRQVEATAGVVRIDGHDVRDLTTRSAREAVCVVLQETMLLDTSVYDNIAYARPDAGPEEVEAAARAADADTFIRALPDGYQTRVGQRGRTLSGGQRQRLALARAILRGSPVLVLDEPTTGLDPETARRVLAPIRTAVRDRTVLLITHDPVALEFADRVVRLEAGALPPADTPAGLRPYAVTAPVGSAP
ncbi:MAG TPA: ABC transporter ATP-binding protein [Nocardioidaceae bacterium]|nr:ABC transporter ATP-binding protein [Nocardioidaceae bacterium]